MAGADKISRAPRSAVPAAKSRRARYIGASVALVTLLVAGVVSTVIVLDRSSAGGAAPKPSPSAVATPAPGPSTGPAGQAPTQQPEVAVPHMPTDCREIYPRSFLELVAGEELNHESMVDSVISRYPAIEELRESLPGFECHWGLATEGGIANAVNTIDIDGQGAAIALIAANEHVCESYLEGTVCRHSETLGDDGSGSIWTIAEEHFFRDGLWVSTWWAGTATTIEEDTSGIYLTIWP